MVFRGILLLFCGLPFGNLLFKSVDLWHGQGHYFQAGLLIIFCLSFLEKQTCVHALNKPLGILTLWMGLLTCYYWMKAFTMVNQYALKVFLPFFNWLCFIWFYKLCLEYLDKEKIETILKWFRYSMIALLIYCGLQYFRLDEFLRGISGHDELVGTIGNISHLAGYLAIVQPIFFKRKGAIPLILLWIIIVLTGSASGLIVGSAVVLFWLLLKKRYVWFVTGIAFLSTIAILSINKYSAFFSSNGRIELWKVVFEDFKNKAVTGFGLGTFGLMKYNFNSSHWRHLHNEYYQVVFELGIIGLIFLAWCIWEYFRTFKMFRTELTDRLAVMFSGFCLLGLFTFNAHLWMLAAIGMFSYVGLYVIKNGENEKCALV